MSYSTTVKDISTELERLQEEKEKLDKRVEELKGTLLHFQELMESELPSSSPQTIKDAVRARLAQEGKPMHRKDLYDHLQQLGIRVNGQNPVGNMTAHMSQDDRFESVGDGRWGLRQWTHPAKRNEGQGVGHVPTIREPEIDQPTDPFLWLDDPPFRS